MRTLPTTCAIGLWAAVGCTAAPEAESTAPSQDTSDSGEAHDVYVPGHNECLPVGEQMSAETCEAVVAHDGRFPGVSENKSGGVATDDDPRLEDADLLWFETEIRRCACVCCHQSTLGGPGAYFWDLDFEPVWIDSASNWSLKVLGGWTDDPVQTFPTTDQERFRAVIETEWDRRREL